MDKQGQPQTHQRGRAGTRFSCRDTLLACWWGGPIPADPSSSFARSGISSPTFGLELEPRSLEEGVCYWHSHLGLPSGQGGQAVLSTEWLPGLQVWGIVPGKTESLEKIASEGPSIGANNNHPHLGPLWQFCFWGHTNEIFLDFPRLGRTSLYSTAWFHFGKYEELPPSCVFLVVTVPSPDSYLYNNL